MTAVRISVDYEQATAHGLVYPNLVSARDVGVAMKYANHRAGEGPPTDFRLGNCRAVVVRMDGEVIYRKPFAQEKGIPQ